MRPNSPPQTTSVESSSPRCLRSVSRRRDRLVGLPAALAVVVGEVVVGVPLVVAVDLHEPDAALDQPARQQALLAEGSGHRVVQPVEPPGVLGLGREVDGLRRLGLHPVGQLVVLDAGEQVGLAGMLLGMLVVQPRREVEHPALAVLAHIRGPVQVEDRRRPASGSSCPDRLLGRKPEPQLPAPPCCPWRSARPRSRAGPGSRSPGRR